jgi:molecular chaperone GrpE
MTKEHKIEIQSEPESKTVEAATPESEAAPPEAAGHASENEVTENDVADPSTEEPPATESVEDLSSLQAQLEKAQNEAQEHYERFLRTAAELDNFRKRKEREVSDLRKYANQNLLRELLNVVDNLERAIGATQDAGTTDGLVEGVDMTLKEFSKFLKMRVSNRLKLLIIPLTPICMKRSCRKKMKIYPKIQLSVNFRKDIRSTTDSCGRPWWSYPDEVSRFDHLLKKNRH